MSTAPPVVVDEAEVEISAVRAQGAGGQTAHVLHAVGVDVNLDAGGLDHLVPLLRGIFPPELVREARAAASDHA